jgi:hypothetical protein
MNDRLLFNLRGGLSDAPSLAPVVDPQGASPRTSEPASAEAPERWDWAFFFLLAFTAVVFLRPQDSIPGLHFLHLAELSAIGALASLIGGRLGRNLPITRVTPELVGVVALGGLILATAPFSIWFSGAIGVFTEYYGKTTAIYVLMVNVLTSPRRIERSRGLCFRRLSRLSRGVRLCARRKLL